MRKLTDWRLGITPHLLWKTNAKPPSDWQLPSLPQLDNAEASSLRPLIACLSSHSFFSSSSIFLLLSLRPLLALSNF